MEGLAQRIVRREVPDSLLDRRGKDYFVSPSNRAGPVVGCPCYSILTDRVIQFTVISIDLGSIIAGTAVRGSFEEKFRALLKDIEEEKGKVIIFVGMSARQSCEVDADAAYIIRRDAHSPQPGQGRRLTGWRQHVEAIIIAR
jgi:hypothetical protein